MAKGLYIHLYNFEGDGKSVKVSLEALTRKTPRRIIIAGRVGKRSPKPIKRRNDADRKINCEVEKK